MIERVLDKDQLLLALIIRKNYSSKGTCFFTPNEFPQQMAYMHHAKGEKIQAHVHNRIPREVFDTQEVLFIKTGQLKVDFFCNDKTFIESKILEAGDIILLASGGHGFQMLEETEMIEVKQGPYLGEFDKVRF